MASTDSDSDVLCRNLHSLRSDFDNPGLFARYTPIDWSYKQLELNKERHMPAVQHLTLKVEQYSRQGTYVS